ncbi:hypothetical protein COLO4_06845 [Corchorus olitorius]|uniref:Uncharacterized protein n=1 Tax=Corchorus olitorius TaxID=93759 RepID=A0A1R3KLQ7_9ROSI|nr:hypothetical protein COLO4_06845 [Corchorus olitorius]
MAAKLTKLLKLIMEGNDAYGHSLGDWIHSIHTIIIPYDLELSDHHLLYIAERSYDPSQYEGDRKAFCIVSTFGLERKQTTDDDYEQGFKWRVKEGFKRPDFDLEMQIRPSTILPNASVRAARVYACSLHMSAWCLMCEFMSSCDNAEKFIRQVFHRNHEPPK